MKNKAIIRQNMISQLKNFQTFAKEEKKRETKEVLAKFVASELYRDAEKIALYFPQEIEFDLKVLFEDRSKRFLLPKTLSYRQMIFAAYNKNQLERTTSGLLEPTSAQEELPDLIVVPGLAWNFKNYRVGFGGGYYDRYLANFKGKTVSLIYYFQEMDFEEEGHDIRINEVFKKFNVQS